MDTKDFFVLIAIAVAILGAYLFGNHVGYNQGVDDMITLIGEEISNETEELPGL
jgi:uncharacterized protein (DUF2164 family)